MITNFSSVLVPAGWDDVLEDPCTQSWGGVTCSSGVIVDLNLGYLSLAGSLSPSLGFLTGLTSISLGGNAFTGTLPDGLSELVNVQVMLGPFFWRYSVATLFVMA
jgi:hypothetical protein